MNDSLHNRRRCLVLIPAYEPDGSLLTFVKDLLQEDLQVLVIDDGSTPPHRSIFDTLPEEVILLTYDTNRGKGYAMKYGMTYIKHHLPDVDFIVTADADGQHSPKDTLKTLHAATQYPDALILGVRTFPKNTPLRSRIGNYFTANLFRCLTKIDDLRDTQTGLRAFSRSHLDFILSVDGERYEYEMKQLLLWSRLHAPIIQVPIETIYRDKDNSTSHYDTLKDSAKIFRALLNNGEAILFTISGILSFLLDFLLFNLFHFLLKSSPVFYALIIPNILARLFSAMFNFNVNRHYVFESKDSLKRDAVQYTLLVVFLLALNSAMLSILSGFFVLKATLAKLLVELIIFVLSYFIQRFYIFSNDRLSP